MARAAAPSSHTMRAASADHTSGRSLSTCVVAVWLSWGSHDYLQELVFHHGFHHAIFMALSLQVTSFLLSTVHEAALNRWSHTYARYQSASVAAPYHTMCLWYCSVSVCIALANGLSTSALNYVDMATKVMFKSSKIVVVMCTGSLLFARRYKALEYGAMALACSGLMVFSLSGLPATLGALAAVQEAELATGGPTRRRPRPTAVPPRPRCLQLSARAPLTRRLTCAGPPAPRTPHAAPAPRAARACLPQATSPSQTRARTSSSGWVCSPAPSSSTRCCPTHSSTCCRRWAAPRRRRRHPSLSQPPAAHRRHPSPSQPPAAHHAHATRPPVPCSHAASERPG